MKFVSAKLRRVKIEMKMAAEVASLLTTFPIRLSSEEVDCNQMKRSVFSPVETNSSAASDNPVIVNQKQETKRPSLLDSGCKQVK